MNSQVENSNLVKFNPHTRTVGFFEKDIVYSFKDLKDETMFFSCEPSFIRNHKATSPITNALLEQVMERVHHDYPNGFDGLNIVVDTRVNMLMPGQWPSIPGWHCDDVPRAVKYAQPDFSGCNPNVQHYMCLISDTKNPSECISGTEFVVNPRTYNINPAKVWQSLHEEVDKDTEVETRFVKEREIVKFDQYAIHRASPAKTNGWRIFFRLSITHRKPANEIRNHVQVYVDPSQAGW